jgi:hypothetical protein
MSTSAVMVSDEFFTFREVFSSIPFMPSYSVSEVRPSSRSGRPASAGFMRTMTRSSIGSTL